MHYLQRDGLDYGFQVTFNKVDITNFEFDPGLVEPQPLNYF
jgi:hypothetical protein